MVFIPALAGLVLGIAIDYFFISKTVKNAYKLNIIWPILAIIFYSLCMFGFFMGVPLFNFLLGIPIGFFVVRKEKILGTDPKQAKMKLKKAAVFGSILMFAVCLASAFIALRDPYTASGIQGMLSLPFEITKHGLIALITTGGTILTVGEYFLILLTSKF